jgi:hypothetical protein
MHTTVYGEVTTKSTVIRTHRPGHMRTGRLQNIEEKKRIDQPEEKK